MGSNLVLDWGENRNSNLCICGRRKVLRNDLCRKCRDESEWSYRRVPRENPNNKHYCQWAYCTRRLKEFKRSKMLEYDKLLFHSQKCIEEFKNGN